MKLEIKKIALIVAAGILAFSGAFGKAPEFKEAKVINNIKGYNAEVTLWVFTPEQAKKGGDFMTGTKVVIGQGSTHSVGSENQDAMDLIGVKLMLSNNATGKRLESPEISNFKYTDVDGKTLEKIIKTEDVVANVKLKIDGDTLVVTIDQETDMDRIREIGEQIGRISGNM